MAPSKFSSFVVVLVLVVLCSILSVVVSSEGEKQEIEVPKVNDSQLLDATVSAINAKYDFSGVRKEVQRDEEEKIGKFHFGGKDRAINFQILRDPFLHLEPEGIIRLAGYPVEIHEATTEDGFVIKLFRIPRGKQKEAPEKIREPVLLMPGFAVSCDCWILISAERALPFLLADEGYDVWLGNYRGNDYARKHLKYNEEQVEYWKFSYEEIGLYDIPAMTDYILNKTGKPKLSYIGHSMSGGAPLITLSMKPEYHDKIQKVVALAPLTYMENTRMPLRYLTLLPDKLILEVMDRRMQGRLSFYKMNLITKLLLPTTCLEEKGPENTCSSQALSILGFSSPEFNRTTIARGLRRLPSVNPIRILVHAFQSIKSSVFARFDHGPVENMKKYGQNAPPAYNLSLVTTPVYTLYAPADIALPPKDIIRGMSEIKNPVNSKTAAVNYDTFSHIDFLFHDKAKTLVYDRIINFLNNYKNDGSFVDAV